VDIHDPNSIAFLYLTIPASDPLVWHSVERVGWDLGLRANQIRDVTQLLASLGMIEWRTVSRGRRMSEKYESSIIITEAGIEHVKSPSATQS
jgi:hypothetical protein